MITYMHAKFCVLKLLLIFILFEMLKKRSLILSKNYDNFFVIQNLFFLGSFRFIYLGIAKSYV